MQAPKQNMQRTLITEATHHAILIGLIELGTMEVEWEGNTKEVPKIRVTFEITDEKKEWKEGEGEKPMVISQEYSYSMGSKAKLRKLVEGILGTALLDEEAYTFNMEDLLGKNCLLSIKHKTSKSTGNKYQIVDGASAPLKSMPILEPENKIKVLSYEKWDENLYEELPEFIKEQMRDTPEYQKMKNPVEVKNDSPKVHYPENDDNKEIPF